MAMAGYAEAALRWSTPTQLPARLPPLLPAACRLGWATRQAELNAPVGADEHGFGYRSKEGSKVNGRGQRTAHAAARADGGKAAMRGVALRASARHHHHHPGLPSPPVPPRRRTRGCVKTTARRTTRGTSWAACCTCQRAGARWSRAWTVRGPCPGRPQNRAVRAQMSTGAPAWNQPRGAPAL